MLIQLVSRAVSAFPIASPEHSSQMLGQILESQKNILESKDTIGAAEARGLGRPRDSGVRSGARVYAQGNTTPLPPGHEAGHLAAEGNTVALEFQH